MTAAKKKVQSIRKVSSKKPKLPLKNRELSWLSFNERVLQEAMDNNVPLLEKLKFLSIFSSNMDEFFRVRVASLRRLIQYQKKNKMKEVAETEAVFSEVQKMVVQLQGRFNDTYEFVKRELAENKIFIINESQLNFEQKLQVQQYFRQQVSSTLFPIILDHLREFPFLRDKSIYQAIKMYRADGKIRPKFALIEVPSDVVGRFYVLPKKDDNTFVMFLDDVIRTSLDQIFSNFEYDTFESYTVKLTRDAELEIDNDLSQTLIEKISKGLKERTKGAPVRFIYDREISPDLLDFMVKKLRLPRESLIPGSRYHNFKDFGSFPAAGLSQHTNPPLPLIPIAELENARSMFDVIGKKDILLHHPYHSFDYVIRLLREAAIDPNVYAIKISLYRVARQSNVVNALINAVKNGKDVTAVIELQARFDEEANLYWAHRLQEEGAKVVFGIPNYKVHSKVCVIYRKENNKSVHYAHLSTGNYNGITSRAYCDIGILTSDPRLAAEATKVFNLVNNFPRINYSFKHLLVSPLYMKKEFLKLLGTEIKNAKAGKEAYLIAKMNSLVDVEMIEKLYEASQAGVKVKMIVRGICCLKPGIKGISENIEAISIVDKFLEHTRAYIFCNGGKEKYYLSSADWMSRNLDHRIEVAFPIFDPAVRKTIKDILEIQLSDNVKARVIDGENDNSFKTFSLPVIRSQVEIYNYLLAKGSETQVPKI